MKPNLILGAVAIAMASTALVAAPAMAHPGETHAPVPQSAEGEGVVTALDAHAATITLDHGPIASLGWPAMTMTFPLHSASLLDGVRVGARVHFVLMNNNGRPMVSEIHVL